MGYAYDGRLLLELKKRLSERAPIGNVLQKKLAKPIFISVIVHFIILKKGVI